MVGRQNLTAESPSRHLIAPPARTILVAVVLRPGPWRDAGSGGGAADGQLRPLPSRLLIALHRRRTRHWDPFLE